MKWEAVVLVYTPLSAVDIETFGNGGEELQTSDL